MILLLIRSLVVTAFLFPLLSLAGFSLQAAICGPVCFAANKLLDLLDSGSTPSPIEGGPPPSTPDGRADPGE